MSDFGVPTIGSRNIWHCIDLPMPMGGFRNMAQGDYLMMHRTARWRFAAGVLAHPMDAIFLHQTGCDLRDALAAEKRIEVVTKPRVMVADLLLAALAVRHHVMLAFKLLCGLLESWLVLDFATCALAPQFKVPIFGKILRLRQASLFGAHAAAFPRKNSSNTTKSGSRDADKRGLFRLESNVFRS
ncbi:MAG: hypothetical protein AAF438_23600 [Pseudomonadota bacterium]